MKPASLFLVAATFCACSCTSVKAQPQVPDDFNEKLVKSLVRDVDQGTNYPLLKLYFTNRQKASFPATRGLLWVQTQLRGHKNHDSTWFRLKALEAFGQMHLQSQGGAKALTSYSALFKAALAPQQTPAPEVLKRVVLDFCSYVMTGYFQQKRGTLGSEDEAPYVTLKAMRVYFRLGSPLGVWKPNWQEVIWRTWMTPEEVIKAVDLGKEDKAAAKNLNFYLTGATATWMSNTSDNIKAASYTLGLLDKAEPLLAGNADAKADWQNQKDRLLVKIQRIKQEQAEYEKRKKEFMR